MPSRETPTSLCDLIGDRDPAQIIENLLVPAPYPGANTQKYFAAGLPEVIVRHTSGEPEPAMRATVAAAFTALPRYGVPTLPYFPVTHDDEVYVFTQKVHGSSLSELASPTIEPGLVHRIDTQWAQMITYYHTARAEGFASATDIFGLSQHMYGRTSTDCSDTIRLVDLGNSAFNYTDITQLQDSGFERELIGAANDIVAIEPIIARRLLLARAALDSALTYAAENPSTHNPNGPTFIAAARFIVAEMAHVDPDDDEDFYDRFAP